MHECFYKASMALIYSQENKESLHMYTPDKSLPYSSEYLVVRNAYYLLLRNEINLSYKKYNIVMLTTESS